MKNIIVALGVLSMAGFAAPALAQTTPAPDAPMAAAPDASMAKALPKCGGRIQDSCDQSQTTEKNAMTAAQAEKSGGVGDRHVGGKGMAMSGKSMHSKHHTKHHMKHKATTKTTTTTETPPPPAM